jgi:outer membrane protein assembly factor BamB
MRLRMLLLAFAVMLVSAACGPVDWVTFHFEADRSGSSPDTSISREAVSSVVLNWTATTGGLVDSSPAVANGVVYVGSDDKKLYAFDAAGVSNCSGTPKSCSPIWSAPTGGVVFSSPAVVDGVVYVGSEDQELYAFDATGRVNCSGTPKTCSPLWTAATGGLVDSSPAVINGVVYVGSTSPTGGPSALYAFDAAGSTNCSGTPKTCAPLWNAPTTGGATSPAVAGGVTYVASNDGKVYAFDAAGGTNCSGSPKTCTPLWTAATTGQVFGAPAVVNGVVYVGSGTVRGPANADALFAFDAAGSTNCSGSPKTCAPLWTAPTTSPVVSSPAVANGVVYVNAPTLYAFDAAGSTNCSGSPKTCPPLWAANAGRGSPSSPAVANGVVYVGDLNGLYAFDAAGRTNCSGSPTTCSPLFTSATGGNVFSSPAVSNGAIYVGDRSNRVYAFGLEKIPPTTSVVIPSNGAIVSGTTLLDASASDDVNVSRVEFHLGSNGSERVIGVATPTQYGWIYNWDSASVPNGSYTLESVAYDSAGNHAESAVVTITVQN